MEKYGERWRKMEKYGVGKIIFEVKKLKRKERKWERVKDVVK